MDKTEEKAIVVKKTPLLSVRLSFIFTLMLGVFIGAYVTHMYLGNIGTDTTAPIKQWGSVFVVKSNNEWRVVGKPVILSSVQGWGYKPGKK